MAKSTAIKVKETDHAEILLVKRTGKPDIELPLNKNSSRRLRQMDAAQFRGTLREYMDLLHKSKKLEELEPIQLKQLADAARVSDELTASAWEDERSTASDGSVQRKDDNTDLISQAVKAGMKLKKEADKISAKNTPIDMEAEDVD